MKYIVTIDAVERCRYMNSNKIYCPNGHEYTKENTYISRQVGRNPARKCRICTLTRMENKN